MKSNKAASQENTYNRRIFIPLAIAAVLALSFGWDAMSERTLSQTTPPPCLGPDFTPGFTNAPNFTVGSVPNAIATGDFNGDGIQDLAIANRSPNNNVAIRLGNGSGGFTSPPTPQVAVGTDPVSIAVGDFNGDGKADFVTANQESDSVSIRLGNGAGGFTLAATPEIALAGSPTFVAAADFTQDGRQDFVVVFDGTALRTSGADDDTIVNVYAVNAADQAVFVGTARIPSRRVSTLIKLGFLVNLNSDGTPDLLLPFREPVSRLLGSGGSTAILLGDGAGGFLSPSPPNVPFNYEVESVAAADFSGDGKPDLLATGEASGGRVSIRLGDGAGGFTTAAVPEVAVGAGAFLVKVADFNGDGKMDFATGNDSTVSIRLGNGLGGFTSPLVAEVQVGLIVGALTIGEFNNDGRPDFAAVINDPNGTSRVVVRLGNCTSTAASPTPTPSPTATPTSPPLDPDFDPNANDFVSVIVVQTDGKILIGGSFSSVAPNGGAPVVRNRIARFNADGTLDTAFNPNANGQISAIAVQADGRILIGGSFTFVGGQQRNAVARVDGVTGVADSFDPRASSVLAIAVQADGKILVGGGFQTISSQTRRRIARVNADGTLDTAFNPDADLTVESIVVQADGQILVGGQFSNIGGQTRNRIARLNPATGSADAFNPNASATVMSAARVSTIALQANGQVLAGGFFNSIGGQPRMNLARLDASTGAADAFNANLTITNTVNAIAVEADSRFLVGSSTGVVSRLTRYNADGTLTTFNVTTGNGGVSSIAAQPNGNFLVGGTFTTIAGQPRGRIARFAAPTPTISGRVTTPSGQGLRNAVVSLIDSNGVRRTATTSSFGVYSFGMIRMGETYTMTVSSKRYRFSPQTPTISNTLTILDLVGLE